MGDCEIEGQVGALRERAPTDDGPRGTGMGPRIREDNGGRALTRDGLMLK